jgi:clan AA aspartic protease
MTQGKLIKQRLVVPFVIRGENDQDATVSFVLDTGYSGTLTLPTTFCEQLGLTRDHSQTVVLADGSSVMLDVYFGTILWDDEERFMEIIAVDSDPLLGITALEGY